VPISELARLVQQMQPTLNPGVYAFSCAPAGFELGSLEIAATIREPEGLTIVAEEASLQRAGLAIMFRAAWITLSVSSDLNAIGFSALVSTALAQARISCNIIAGAHHDHLFVPVELADRALEVLLALR
jgi:hypothetical protein